MSQAEKIGVIVMGANGRMGQTLIKLLAENEELVLAAAVDREKYMGKFPIEAPFFESIEKAAAFAPKAGIIDFSAPEASLSVARTAAASKLACVIGTTGLNAEQKAELANFAKKTAILYAPNMSVGVNVVADMLALAATELGPSFDMEMVEAHHRQKKDAPSGTAVFLAEEMANARGWELSEVLNVSRHGLTGERPAKEIGIQSLRGGDVRGIHSIYFFGSGEYIKVEHVAESRETFANGALRAVKWLKGQQGGKLYTMRDMLTASGSGEAKICKA